MTTARAFAAGRTLVLAMPMLCSCVSSPPDATQADRSGPGMSAATAIEVCRPAGERTYLERLICADGALPAIGRRVNVGNRAPVPASEQRTMTPEEIKLRLDRLFEMKAPPPGEPDTHIVDRYELICGSTMHFVHLDMYHCDGPPPQVVPPGFKLRSP
jgi:hypothetical protein